MDEKGYMSIVWGPTLFSIAFPYGGSDLTNLCTCSLVVESHHVTANSPQWIRIVVGGLYTLTFGVDPT